ncbi:MAG: hypothetical protein RL037_1342 [Bacteroidota bacterium]
MKTLFLSLFFISMTSLCMSQTDLSVYAGNWKMTPANPTHSFSSINIVNNGMTVTIKLKKNPFKTYTARINPQTNRLETYINQTGYYFVLGNNNTMAFYQTEGNIKVGDYKK